MAEHYCKEHKTVWFMKGKMKNFAHPVLDVEGEPVLEDGKAVWCNEPKEEKPHQTETKYQRGSPEERNSIESQVAIKEVGEDWRAGKLKDTDQLVLTRKNWLMSKLGNWSSMGLPDSVEPIRSPVKTGSSAVVSAEEVIKDLKLILDSKKITSPEVVHILREQGGKGTGVREMVKSLSPEGLAKFVARVKPLVPHLVKEAKRLGAEEIENLPF